MQLVELRDELVAQNSALAAGPDCAVGRDRTDRLFWLQPGHRRARSACLAGAEPRAAGQRDRAGKGAELSPEHLDPGLLDERVGATLNLVAPNELVIMRDTPSHQRRLSVTQSRPAPALTPIGCCGLGCKGGDLPASSRWVVVDPGGTPEGCEMSATRKNRPAGVAEIEASPKELLGFYRDMLLIRRFEERAGQMYGMGLIGGFCHLYIGQEAVVVGMQAALKEGDTVVTSYRDHGHMLACGMDPKGVMAELTGRRTGYSRGKGGSMHMFSREKNFFGGHGIVGAQVPIGTGLAFAHRYRDNGLISLTYLGDGAINQGQVYESFNMAALWKLPVVYVIENNRYGMGTAIDRASARTDLFHRGMAHGIPGEQVDGMNVLAVHEAGLAAAEHVRSGQGPLILEMLTYRYRGHSMSDPAKYRTREEVERVRTEHDPIEQARRRLIAGGTDEAVLKGIEAEVRKIVAEAAQFAQDSPEPDPSELWTDVLIDA